MLDAARDLLLGGACVGCARPGRPLCPPCRAAVLDVRPAPAWPCPSPAGLTDPWAATLYAGTVRAAILGHKERRMLALAEPLGELLALAVAVAASDLASGTPASLVLVPVPSRPGSTRERGHEPTTRLTRAAAARLTRLGLSARCVRLLRTRRGVADQSGLDAGERARNLAGAFRVRTPAFRMLVRAGPIHIVVCDDVLTTGATAAEAQRALRSVGLEPLAAVAVAATRRRREQDRASGPAERLSSAPESG